MRSECAGERFESPPNGKPPVHNIDHQQKRLLGFSHEPAPGCRVDAFVIGGPYSYRLLRALLTLRST